ncbi:MAG TPA: hypothetical protein VN256_07180 [Pyrinomonadaceae bacterium]|nr:hypothetical protein [Pyrinomonadaceae bacterium]
MAAAAPAPRKKIIQLDVLRLLAVLLVLGRHIEPIPEQTSALGRVLKGAGGVWLRCGWIGVDLFFVLSGFLVSGLLFREYADSCTPTASRSFPRAPRPRTVASVIEP